MKNLFIMEDGQSEEEADRAGTDGEEEEGCGEPEALDPRQIKPLWEASSDTSMQGSPLAAGPQGEGCEAGLVLPAQTQASAGRQAQTSSTEDT